jgi:hypothetical protein
MGHGRGLRLAVALGMVGIALVGVSGANPAYGADSPRAGLKPIHPSPDLAGSVNTLTVHSSASRLLVSPHPKVYLVFWGSQWAQDPAGAMSALTGFFSALHGSVDTYDKILAQYCEGVPAGTSNCGTAGIHIKVPTSTLLRGAWNDNAAPAPTHATQAQIAAEALSAATHFGNTTQTPNLNAEYVIVSATGTHPDGFPNTGFCGWHAATNTSAGMLAYTNLPYVPDLGIGACTTIASPNQVDGLLSTETHEYSETVTDFVPNNGWNGGNGEIGDECVNLDGRITLSTGTFDVQGEWSNSANACVTSA